MDAPRLSPAAELRTPEPGQPLQFRRNRHGVRGRTRRVRLRLGHILVLLALVAALFVGVQRMSLLAFSSGAFALRTIDLSGATGPSRPQVEGLLDARRGISLFLIDSGRLRDEIQALSWVKEARVTKVLPSRLNVWVKERTVMAVLDEGTPVLIDDEGVRLEPVDPAAPPALPLIRAEGGFDDDYEGKIALARACLKALPDARRRALAAIDVSRSGRVGLELRDDPLRIYCRPERASAGLDYVERRLAEWRGRFGTLEYVDLTIPDRTYLGPARAGTSANGGPAAAARNGSGTPKEVL